ncbi:hypothetical protein D477_002663 [Arthrobacter crystallopoietes BAB-32]|uniref:Uncharacterized protein n=1 Tax=Arthrobacter crystallopoietes BAB-32 TaxID=1246476 RepID=N1V6Y5_9MICC|nr:hypothetical protein [Arthrobacter crystallopoietes]EMY35759.1 hypothetical protein D477_002663 [Arthrobacter crystallopoietes BAB-32]
MSTESVIHSIGNAKLGPNLAALGAANRLAKLDPLAVIKRLDETLARAEEVMAEKAMARQETQNIVDQLRSKSKQRRSTKGL